MGLDVNGVKFLLHARARGLDLSSVAMIGRQSLHLERKELGRLLREFGHHQDEGQVEDLFSRHNGYAEGLLTLLGATTVHSYDFSDYEQATHVHDMNLPIPDAWREQYAVVLDSGSLEHIFNVPVALRNCMQMVKPGGHFIGISPVNNFMGHGFYQFSPEFFYRALSDANGFEVDKLILFENRPRARWYLSKDPSVVRRRVTLSNSVPTYALVLARRTAIRKIFATPPQQSDYAADWAGGREAERRDRLSAHVLSRKIYKPLERTVKRLARCFFSAFNRRFFEPFDPHP